MSQSVLLGLDLTILQESELRLKSNPQGDVWCELQNVWCLIHNAAFLQVPKQNAALGILLKNNSQNTEAAAWITLLSSWFLYRENLHLVFCRLKTRYDYKEQGKVGIVFFIMWFHIVRDFLQNVKRQQEAKVAVKRTWERKGAESP